jgi:serine phosphatase RsbU (regulator of sigma subunit)
VLNLTLRQSAIGGFTTCLCADVSPTGSLRIANAGHLSPYRNGAELPVSNGLPLGLVDRIDYPQTPLQLDPGDTLTFLSDGVVEARNAKRELFGFERTRQMSTLTARQLAEAARQFGQEDDITVLTLTLTGAAVLARVLV